MNQIMVFKSNYPDIGFRSRSVTSGDEYALVEQFIDYYCSDFLRNNKKTQLAVFIEPGIDSGFPDVVFASFLPSIIDNWSDKREKLEIIDLKLLSYLADTKSVRGKTIISKLRFPEKEVLASLERLMDAKLVSYCAGGWIVSKLRDVFSITKLIAVEAKMNDISKVIDQSFVNTRFASQSYALTNSTKPRNETIQKFSSCGVGLYCKGTRFTKYVEAKQHTLPSSYLSYQFNEWIGKAITRKGDLQNAGF